MSLAPVSQHGASAAVGGSVASLLWAALQAASRGQPVPALTPEVVCTCLSEAAEAAASVWPVADRSHLLAFVAGVLLWPLCELVVLARRLLVRLVHPDEPLARQPASCLGDPRQPQERAPAREYLRLRSSSRSSSRTRVDAS